MMLTESKTLPESANLSKRLGNSKAPGHSPGPGAGEKLKGVAVFMLQGLTAGYLGNLGLGGLQRLAGADAASYTLWTCVVGGALYGFGNAFKLFEEGSPAGKKYEIEVISSVAWMTWFHWACAPLFGN